MELSVTHTTGIGIRKCQIANVCLFLFTQLDVWWINGLQIDSQHLVLIGLNDVRIDVNNFTYLHRLSFIQHVEWEENRLQIRQIIHFRIYRFFIIRKCLTYPIPSRNSQHRCSGANPKIVAISLCEIYSDRSLANVEFDVRFSYMQLDLLPLRSNLFVHLG